MKLVWMTVVPGEAWFTFENLNGILDHDIEQSQKECVNDNEECKGGSRMIWQADDRQQ